MVDRSDSDLESKPLLLSNPTDESEGYASYNRSNSDVVGNYNIEERNGIVDFSQEVLNIDHKRFTPAHRSQSVTGSNNNINRYSISTLRNSKSEQPQYEETLLGCNSWPEFNRSTSPNTKKTLKHNANARIAMRVQERDHDPLCFHDQMHATYEAKISLTGDKMTMFDEMHYRCLHRKRYDIDDNNWKNDIQTYVNYMQPVDSQGFRKHNRQIRQFYLKQNTLISSYLEAEKRFGDVEEGEELDYEVDESVKDHIANVSSNVINILLALAKLIVVYFSGSLSIVSSLVDSVVDLFVGLLLWYTAYRVKNTNPLIYPIGRQPLEPVAVVVCSAVMATASIQVIAQAVRQIISAEYSLDVNYITLIIMCSTIGLKIILFIYCKRLSSSTAQALALDHMNDVVSNAGALVFAAIASHYWKPLDPIGAILIALFIIISWIKQGYEEVKGLSGHSAEPDFLNTLTWIARNHHPDILAVETVAAYHFGPTMIAEVDIVLCPFTALPVAHDIAETLQMKLEELQEIERAFVHIDFEIYHERRMEHVRGH